METLFILLVFASFILLIIGFFSPKTSLFWYKQERTRKKSAIIYALFLFVSLIFVGATGDNKKTNNGTTSENSSGETIEKKNEEQTSVKQGEVLHTEYFDIVVHKVGLSEGVNTGNEFADLKPEQGSMYLIINTTFKNIDNESRMLSEGSVWINYNGKDYEFDKSETILADGYGLLLEQINPLIAKTTNLVYKIPAEIKGDAYWQPGRANSDQRILLGNLK